MEQGLEEGSNVQLCLRDKVWPDTPPRHPTDKTCPVQHNVSHHTHTQPHTSSEVSFRLGLYLKNTDPSQGTNADGCRVMTAGTMQSSRLQLKQVQHFNLGCKQCSSCLLPNNHVCWRALTPPSIEGRDTSVVPLVKSPL